MKVLGFLIFLFITHGVNVDVSPARAFIVSAQYSDGTPMAGAFVTITSPNGEKVEGELDDNGKFIFTPEIDGEWKIEIDDGLGHGEVVKLKVEGGSFKRKGGGRVGSQFEDIILGLSLIFGITGILFYVVARRKYAHS